MKCCAFILSRPWLNEMMYLVPFLRYIIYMLYTDFLIFCYILALLSLLYASPLSCPLFKPTYDMLYTSPPVMSYIQTILFCAIYNPSYSVLYTTFYPSSVTYKPFYHLLYSYPSSTNLVTYKPSYHLLYPNPPIFLLNTIFCYILFSLYT